MKRLIAIVFFLSLFSNNCSRKTQAVQTFSPLSIDIQKVEQKDYSEILSVVSNSYERGKYQFVQAEAIREEAMFIYIRLTTKDPEDGCCRLSIDKNRKAIVNMQPDCPVSK